MDFELNKEQKALREKADAVLQNEVEPIIAAYGQKKYIDHPTLRQIYKALAPLGYLGSTIPREAGGAGLDHVTYGVLLETLAKANLSLGEMVPPRTMYFLGNPQQQKKFLPDLLSGNIVSTACISEPQAGSDPRGIQTTAVLHGDHYVINGCKAWVFKGSLADMVTVLAITDPEKGHKGTSRFIVDRRVSAFQVKNYPTVGFRTIPLSELTFKDCKVPKENMLGVPGQGLKRFYKAMEASRALIGIQAVGLAQAALDIAVAYSRKRIQFGKPIGSFQLIQNYLAEAATEVDAARLICYRALAKVDQGLPAAAEAAMAKWYATEVAVKVGSRAIQIMGAYGLTEAAGVEKCLRDAKMLTIQDGTTEIMKLIVGRDLTGLRAFS
jgi:alkylation response protein AidB-like acyl-CoA dehydrogenase